ncbi:lipid-A-disaccharide synthase [Granulicella arctica]|uniref:Lipid-A-disaccharide synthase n=1 Tax=Granulicella arctica TaxID=940613 RepID=A0A7Y9TLT8_9BACT|nr:lipid-A-disaccharide synthase [Granulicella arctica]NYF80457.1 lipid-A-disaccharide synthase [Granulicella arctica]
MPSLPEPPKKLSPQIFLSAGEASGEHYGAQIIAEMRVRIPGMTCFGLGGTEMEAAGLERIVRAEDVAVMGITEVVRHMPHIYAEYRRLVASIKARRPDIAVLIDFPDVNFRLAKVLKRLGIPVVYFVSPQLWAWKRSRLRWVQQRISRMLVIFPFEERFYRARGVEAEFVGHPLATLPLPMQTREEFAAQYGLDPAKQWIALLPGSRRKEVHLNLPEMVQAAAQLREEQSYEVLLPVASTVGMEFVRTALQEFGAVDSITLVDDARAAMHHARASIVASGTATVQAAVIGNPFVVVYRVSPLTFRLAKRLVRYPVEIPAPLDEVGNLPIAMVNLIAGRRIVPELLQERFTAVNLVAALRPLLEDGPARETMIAELAEVRGSLMLSAGSSPICRVCDTVQSLLG